MTWKKNEEEYDETVGQGTGRVQKGMGRVLGGYESERSRRESVTWPWGSLASDLTRAPKFGSRA